MFSIEIQKYVDNHEKFILASFKRTAGEMRFPNPSPDLFTIYTKHNSIKDRHFIYLPTKSSRQMSYFDSNYKPKTL